MSIRRATEICEAFFELLNNHVIDVSMGKIEEFMEINEIANKLFISHQHLSDTVQKETGHHPCYFYDNKIIEEAKKVLLNTDLTVAEVARKLTYDPSNFSKFFKKLVGQTPNVWRKNYKLK